MKTTSENARSRVADAFRRFNASLSIAEANEADTRCSLVDAILSALDWQSDELGREVSTSTGDFVDYELPRSAPVMVVEAKRAGSTFALDPAPLSRGSRTRSISTLLSGHGQHLRDALKQAAGYCNDRGIPYACATNGFQWIFFRGLSSAYRKWTDGRALVFGSADIVLSSMDLFQACLGRSQVHSSHLARLLTAPTPHELPAPRIPANLIQFKRSTPPPNLTALRREVARWLFGQIHGFERSNMLNSCYVSPGLLPDFDKSLRRLLRDTMKIDGSDISDTSEGGAGHFVDQIRRMERSGPVSAPLLVVGNVGVGKTTLLHKVMSELRAQPLDQDDAPSLSDSEAFYAYIDLESQGSAQSLDELKVQSDTATLITTKLAQSARQALVKRSDISESARSEADPDQETTLRTMLRDVLQRERAIGSSLFSLDALAWPRREYELFLEHRKDSVSFLIHYIRHLRARFSRRDKMRYPTLIILDNLDQASEDYQRCIYALGLRLAKNTPAIVIVSMREDTFHEGRRRRGFLSSSALELVFHVPAPALDQLLRQRLKHASWSLSNNGMPPSLRVAGNEIASVTSSVRDGLLSTPMKSLEVIAALGGHNTRESLRIVRDYVVGNGFVARKAEPSVDYLLECLVECRHGSELPPNIVSVFDTPPHKPPLHFLPLRLLGYYSWAFDHHPERGLDEATECCISRFSAWGYPPEAVELALLQLQHDSLLVAASPLEPENGRLAERLSITATGIAHLHRLCGQKAYRSIIAIFTRWYSSELADAFVRKASLAGGSQGTSLGDIVAADAVDEFDAYLRAAKKHEDSMLSWSLTQHSWLRETLARSDLWTNTLADIDVRSVEDARTRVDQLTFLESVPLARLPRSCELNGSVWVPRVLWALEHARCNGQRLLTAAGIARVLREAADMDVPATNVARAFRTFKGHAEIEAYYIRSGKRYSISEVGTSVILSLIAAEHSTAAEREPPTPNESEI